MRNMKICISIRNQSHCTAFFGFGLMQTSTFIVSCVCYELIAQLRLISKHDNLRKVTNRVWLVVRNAWKRHNFRCQGGRKTLQITQYDAHSLIINHQKGSMSNPVQGTSFVAWYDLHKMRRVASSCFFREGASKDSNSAKVPMPESNNALVVSCML